MISPPRVGIVRLPHGEGLPLPTYQTAGAAGADVAAAVTEPVVIAPGARALIPTGFVLILPEGWEAQIRPRSGLALRYGVTVLNAPGTIDADYQGEIGVLLVNLGQAAFTVARGSRIAQMVVAPAPQAMFVETASAPPSKGRGAGGFGSTGQG